MKSLRSQIQKQITDMHVNYFTKLSGQNIKTQKKNLTGYLHQNLLIPQISYSISTKLILTKLVSLLWQPLNIESNSNTTSKSLSRDIQQGTQVVYSQENSTGNHNSILLTIYISIHGLCYDCTLSYPNVHVLSSCPLLIHHASTLRPPCHIYMP